MTAIEWTHIPGFKGGTWNPFVGCSKESAGCKNCYAIRTAYRLAEMHKVTGNTPQYEGVVEKRGGKLNWTGMVSRAPRHVLEKPLKAKAPRAYFVNSMSDVFHPNVPDLWIDHVFAVMALCPQHIFMILTKHPKRMRDYFNEYRWEDIKEELADMSDCTVRKRFRNWAELEVSIRNLSAKESGFPLPNVWLGTSVEDQSTADKRIPALLDTPAARRFISAEPLLGLVDLRHLHWTNKGVRLDALQGCEWEAIIDRRLDKIEPPICVPPYPKRRAWRGFPGRWKGLDWVIAGGESGPGARPMHPDWVRSLRDQCASSSVPFFFKQWGAWLPGGQKDAKGFDPIGQDSEPEQHPHDGHLVWKIGKKETGNTLDGQHHLNWPPLGGADLQSNRVGA